MSHSRILYDNCTTKADLNESIGPGIYQLETPPISCTPCYPYPPSVRLQARGNSVNSNKKKIDVDSELLGITRKLSRCSQNKFQPCGDRIQFGYECEDEEITNWPDCFVPREDTRLSNPPCTLRGTGWNRWEWLCQDPQERVERPFDFNIQIEFCKRCHDHYSVPISIQQSLINLPIK